MADVIGADQAAHFINARIRGVAEQDDVTGGNRSLNTLDDHEAIPIR